MHGRAALQPLRREAGVADGKFRILPSLYLLGVQLAVSSATTPRFD